jgi:cholesterol transport system auxiliary component
MTARPSAFLRPAAAAALAFALAGCISVLPKEKPAQLYRFAAAPPVEAAKGGDPNAERIGVFRVTSQFQRESAGDRILTLTGSKAAYIARARWVAPADVLFDEAVTSAYEGASARARLIARGEPAKADYALRLDVRNFETRYDGSRPTVLVRVHAVLLRAQDRKPVAEQAFEAEAAADDNRIGPIVEAYDKALGQVLKDLVAWTDVSLP